MFFYAALYTALYFEVTIGIVIGLDFLGVGVSSVESTVFVALLLVAVGCFVLNYSFGNNFKD